MILAHMHSSLHTSCDGKLTITAAHAPSTGEQRYTEGRHRLCATWAANTTTAARPSHKHFHSSLVPAGHWRGCSFTHMPPAGHRVKFCTVLSVRLLAQSPCWALVLLLLVGGSIMLHWIW